MRKIYDRSCYKCKSTESVEGNGLPHWHRNKEIPGTWLCRRCRAKKQYYDNVDVFRERNRINNPKRQYSHGKRVLLNDNPRVGVCTICRAVADVDCDFTTIHNKTEMCPRCKAKIGQENKILKSISGWHKGRKHSLEHRKSMSIALKGRKPTRLGSRNSEYQKERMSKFRMTQNFPRSDTKPERIIKSMLTKSGIEFQTQIPFVIGGMIRRHKVDFLIRPNIVIECDGDYWHSRPEQLVRDRNIDQQLIANGYYIIRLKDSEILLDYKLCMNKINMVLASVKK